MKVLTIFGLVIGSVLVITIVLPLAFPGRVPPAEVTRSRMAFDRQRILDYAHDHNQLPPTLSALPRLTRKPEADRYLEDAWRRPLIYEVETSGIVTLKSLGRDGLPGGSGQDADVTLSFPSHRPDGSWSQNTDSY